MIKNKTRMMMKYLKTHQKLINLKNKNSNKNLLFKKIQLMNKKNCKIVQFNNNQ